MKKSDQPHPEQMEFDLVSPWMTSPTLRQMEAVRRKAGIRPPENFDEARQLAGLTARLTALDLCDERGVSINDELAELRTIIGPVRWLQEKTIWQRRARRHPLRLKKTLAVLKKKFVG